jgi:DNA-binding XRE family transcriptional regulator
MEHAISPSVVGAPALAKISSARKRVPAWHLKAARLHRGMTQDQLARVLDVRVATISQRENSDEGVAWEIWLAWACSLGLEATWEPESKKPRR